MRWDAVRRYGRVMSAPDPRLPSRTFGSVSVAMVTPFRADGSVDIDAAVAVAAGLVEDGCDALVLNGTTGESPTTHQPEKDDLVRAVVGAVGERAMIIAGAGSNDTAHAVRIAQGAQHSGAAGLLVVSPYYNRPSQEGVYQHIRAVADATDLPVMVYDIPGRTGVAVGDECLDRLAAHPRILAVKDATGDVPAGFERMARTGLEFYPATTASTSTGSRTAPRGWCPWWGTSRPAPTPRWSGRSTPGTCPAPATSPPGCARWWPG